ncbi:COX7a domain-containing protein [Cephalotus follicularis]|uniref:COX7a domain-containing protein n=1 Tax=Cephalotus follicularis TaxID=3775 RepID=A0A1Q3B4B9_CEPFO|nr:COX7a domain-containing protein [Cephalotus follicularis]
MTELTEQPFRPREKLLEKQKYFQHIQKPTYLKGPFDKITSVAIPIALAASSLFLITLRMTELTEQPFRPREKLLEKQKYFQHIQKPTYLKGPFDKITSVAIPIALAASSLFLIGRGIYNMSHNIGKKE